MTRKRPIEIHCIFNENENVDSAHFCENEYQRTCFLRFTSLEKLNTIYPAIIPFMKNRTFPTQGLEEHDYGFILAEVSKLKNNKKKGGG